MFKKSSASQDLESVEFWRGGIWNETQKWSKRIETIDRCPKGLFLLNSLPPLLVCMGQELLEFAQGEAGWEAEDSACRWASQKLAFHWSGPWSGPWPGAALQQLSDVPKWILASQMDTSLKTRVTAEVCVKNQFIRRKKGVAFQSLRTPAGAARLIVWAVLSSSWDFPNLPTPTYPWREKSRKGRVTYTGWWCWGWEPLQEVPREGRGSLLPSCPVPVLPCSVPCKGRPTKGLSWLLGTTGRPTNSITKIRLPWNSNSHKSNLYLFQLY